MILKRRYSGFIGTELDVILRSRGRKTLVMTGIATNGCVEATARDGFMHDYYIVMVDDCCACYSANCTRPRSPTAVTRAGRGVDERGARVDLERGRRGRGRRCGMTVRSLG